MKNYTFIIILITITLLANVFSYKQGHDWGGDFAHYISQSKSIINNNISKFQETYTFTYNYSIEKPGPIFAPWGYPVLLIPVLVFFNMNIFLIKFFGFIFFLISIFLIYSIFKEKLDRPILFFYISIIALHPDFFIFKENIQADYALLCFTYLSFLLIINWINNEKYFINKYVSYAILGVVLYFAFFIKTIGLILLFSLVVINVANLVDKKQLNYRYLLSNISITIPYIIFGILFFLDLIFIPSGHSTYNLNSDRTISESVILNGKVYVENLYNFISVFSSTSPVSKLVNMVIFIVSLVLAGIGLIIKPKKDLIFIVYTFFLLLILLPLPFNGGGFRYIIPVFPIYLYFTFKGLNIIIENVKNLNIRNALSKTITYTCSLIILVFLLKAAFLSYHNFKYKPITDGPYLKSSKEVFSFINKNTKESDIIIFFKPRVMNLYTKRLSYRLSSKLEIFNLELIKQLNSMDWNYIVLKSDIQIDPGIPSDIFSTVFQNDGFIIYKNPK